MMARSLFAVELPAEARKFIEKRCLDCHDAETKKGNLDLSARQADFADREARLIPDDEKVARADFAYVNDGSLADLDAFVAGVVESLSSS